MKRINILVQWSCIAFLFIGHGALAQENALVWTENSFEDFLDGTLDASGQNIYVSHDGKVQVIQRYDLNDDGYLDLFFGNTHDLIHKVAPTQAIVSDDRMLSSSSLPVIGANRVKSGDLNRDGWTDLVFTLERSGLQTQREFLRILYGGADGWTVARLGVLPTNGPLSVEVDDLNGDGWPDITVLNSPSGPFTAERNIRIYWGSDTGFLLYQYQDLGLSGAIALEAADLDKDGVADLMVLAADRVRIYWGSRTDVDQIHKLRDGKVPDGSGGESYEVQFEQTDVSLPDGGGTCMVIVNATENGPQSLAIGTGTDTLYLVEGDKGRDWNKVGSRQFFPGSHLSAGDLDGDGYDELLFTNVSVTGRYATAGGEVGDVDTSKLSPVRVMWGSSQGFSMDQTTTIEEWFGTATAVGDVDGDGQKDIAIAVYQGLEDKRFDSKSLIYFGQGERSFVRAAKEASTSGATDACIVPPEGGLPGRSVFANRLGGTLYERVPNYVYWGASTGFDPSNRWVIPGQSGHDATAADFNTDGFVDLLLTFTAHGGPGALKNPIIGTNILWGSSKGFDLEGPRTILPEPYMDTSATADLNRDGYLDIVLGGWEQWYSDAEDTAAQVAVYYGSADGFEMADKVILRSEGRSNGPIIADFNKDGWLDITVTSRETCRLRIFWGSEKGFDDNRQQVVILPMAMGTEVADLNGDGWLDLVCSGYRDTVNDFRDLGNVILWGGEQGFRQWDSQWLPGYCTLYQAIADFDNDGYLDLFVPNYHGEVHRGDLPSFLYWGGPDGFNLKNRAVLLCDSASDAQAGDFNGDGLLDLAVACHNSFGNHQVDSKIFYNDGKRFTNPEVLRLPTLGAHTLWTQDPGHIYDRSYQQRYESSVFEWDAAARSVHISYQAEEPKGAGLTLEIRTASEPELLKEQSWRSTKKKRGTLSPDDRCMQYRATFRSDNGDRYPVLQQVQIKLAK